MDEIFVRVTVANSFDPARRVEFVGLVDTGDYGLVLPAAWKPTFGPMETLEVVDIETADQRVVTAEIFGPAIIRLDGFRQVSGEVLFVDMAPSADGSYPPLIGYTMLEWAGALVDRVDHRLQRRPF
jgi:hypothetical protein